MLLASAYIITCGAINRLRVRLRRLREPRYLIGTLAAIAYLYFAVFGRMQARAGMRRRPGGALAGVPPDVAAGIIGVGALVVLVVAALAWLTPATSAMLNFTESETDFLFPAPVTRRALILHRFLRSQLGLFFTSIVSAFAFGSLSGYGRLPFVIGAWLFFATSRVYFTGVTLARARLYAGKAGARLAAWIPLGAIAAALAVVVAVAFRELTKTPPEDPVDFFSRLADVLTNGVPRLVLWPFAIGIRPLLLPWSPAYLVALGASAVLFLVVGFWMLFNDEAFEDVARETRDRRAELPQKREPARARDIGWMLPLTGSTEGAFVWKNATEMLRALGATTVRRLLPMTVAIVVPVMAFTSANRMRGAAALVASLALVVSGFTVFFGPQILRTDLRDDLSNLDLLKSWPIRSSAVIRGEMISPVAAMTLVAWAAIVVAALFAGTAFPELAPADRIWMAAAAFAAAPALIAAQYLVHNAIAVLFPAWVPIGNQRARGLEVMGQRLIMLAAVVLSLVTLALPGAIAAAILYFILRGLIGSAALAVGAVAFAIVVFFEILAATEALAPAYERIDILSVERGEN